MESETLAFKDWVKSEGLTNTASLDQLKGKTVVIEAKDHLISLLTRTQTREPLLPALGGLPFGLEHNIKTELDHFAKNGITPIFVFPGLDVACRDHSNISREAQKSVKILDEAWNVYDRGQGDSAVAAFGKTCIYRTEHILRYFQIHLHRQGVRTRVAPYDAAAQMVSLVAARVANICVGSASCLVFGAANVITSFDWDAKSFTWVQTQAILDKLTITQSQFIDMCLLSGITILPTMPEIESESSNSNSSSRINLARNVMKRANMDGHTACLQANDEHYLDLFRKARFAVKHMVICHPDGLYGPIASGTAPSDTHDFISERLPDELFAYHFYGLLGARVLGYRVRQEIFETPPLDGGDSQTYKDLIQDKLIPLRARTQALLTHQLHRYFWKKDIDLVCWFNENEKKQLGLPEMQLGDVGKDAETWHVKDSLMSQSTDAKQLDLTATPLQYAIAVLSDSTLAKKTVTRSKDGEICPLSSPSELLANSIWRFLQDRGYINSDHTLSAWGQALRAAFARARDDGYLGSTDPIGEAEETIFVAFELLRLDVLTSKQLFPTTSFSGAPMRGTDTDKANTLLISRIACLGTFHHDSIGYTGPLSRHLLAYHQMISSVRNSLRDLAEVHASNLMVTAGAARQRENEDDYADWGARLPFSKEPDLGLALVVKSYLDELSNDSGKRADIKRWFLFATDIERDLEKAWKMWNCVNAGVQAADSAIVNSATRLMFENADKWLGMKLQLASNMAEGGESAAAAAAAANGTENAGTAATASAAAVETAA